MVDLMIGVVIPLENHGAGHEVVVIWWKIRKLIVGNLFPRQISEVF